MSVKPLEKWTVVELRAKLKELGQATSGVKAELISRLQQAQSSTEAKGDVPEASVSEMTQQLSQQVEEVQVVEEEEVGSKRKRDDSSSNHKQVLETKVEELQAKAEERSSKRLKLTEEEEIDYDNPIEEEVEGVEGAEGAQEPDAYSRGHVIVPTRYLVITNLKRPFSTPELKTYLATDDCWVNRIRSVAVAKYTTTEEAREAQFRVNGEKWPTAASNALEATFVSQEKAAEVESSGQFVKEAVSKDKKSEAAFREKTWLLQHFQLTHTEPRLYWCPAPSTPTLADKDLAN